jgi:hypothetical protein
MYPGCVHVLLSSLTSSLAIAFFLRNLTLHVIDRSPLPIFTQKQGTFVLSLVSLNILKILALEYIQIRYPHSIIYACSP